MQARSRKILASLAVLFAASCSGPGPATRATSATIAAEAPPSAIATPSAPSTAAAPLARKPDAPASPTAFARLPDETKRAYRRADLIVVAHLEEAKIASVLEIAPPIVVHAFDVVVDRRLAGGGLPSRVDATYSHRERGDEVGAPKPLPEGTPMIVALQRLESTLGDDGTRFVALSVEPYTAELEGAIRAERGTVDEALSWSAAQVPPTHPVQWSNDYGDGEFELTLRNDAGEPRTVPGLYQVGGVVRWAEALVVRDEANRAMPLSRAPLPDGAIPVVLAPGASLSTRVDVKPLGIVQPAGGARFHYSFGIGELRTSSFFYYTHTLHGPLMGKV